MRTESWSDPVVMDQKGKQAVKRPQGGDVMAGWVKSEQLM